MPVKTIKTPKKTRAPRSPKPAKAVCTIGEAEGLGSIQISEDVLAAIAALAATEVDGVACLSGNITHEKAAKVNARTLAKGVKVEIEGNALTVRIIIVVRYGVNIPKTTLQVQARVKSTLETMTGLEIRDVHVSVSDVAPEAK